MEPRVAVIFGTVILGAWLRGNTDSKVVEMIASYRMDCRRGWSFLAALFTLLMAFSGTVVVADGMPSAEASSQRLVVFENAVVAADHPLASAAGAEILRNGGNMVDAAVATSFALSVLRPASCGIGGGGFMVIWNARTQSGVAIDYRERAPAKATREMFLGDRVKERFGDEPSRKGHLAIAVPGTVAGLCFALKEYGTLDLKTVMAPALRFARQGYLIDKHDREVQAELLKDIAEPRDQKRFGPLFRLYLNEGVPWKTGDVFMSPQTKVLELIAANGADGFYRGRVAEAVLTEIRRNGGIISAEDFAAAKPKVRAPLVGEFDGCKVICMPPPSSGGVALLESLNVLSAWEQQNSVKYGDDRLGKGVSLHLLAETLKYAFADRATHLGDADFVKVPVERLTSGEYAVKIAKRIDRDHTHPAAEYGRFAAQDDGGTSHFSIIDREGNAVACTETINLAYGSLVVEPEFGIVLNNQMDDFAAEPGKPNAFGLMQSEANAIQAGKKPLSSMCPTIVVQEGKAIYAVGASGGPRIISGTLQVLLGMMRGHHSPEEAVTEPRIHHQWLPDVLEVEVPLFDEVRGDLERRGHTVRKSEDSSVVQGVSRGGNSLRGGSDPRKGGRSAGY